MQVSEQHNTTLTAQHNSRTAALSAGAPFYNTGKPCKHGHVADRYSSNAMCVDCLRKQRNATAELARDAKRREKRMLFNDMVKSTIWVPRTATTILHTLTELLNAPDAEITMTWIQALRDQPLTALELVPMFAWDGKKVGIDPATYPMRNADDGRLLVQLRNAWYVGDEVMATLRGETVSCNRVWE